MYEFFRGWKRKSGTATLLMACFFLAGWIRSFQTVDYIKIQFPKSCCFLYSDEFGLSWSHHESLRSKRMLVWEHFPQFQIECASNSRYPLRGAYLDRQFGPLYGVPAGDRWHGLGFHVGQGPRPSANGEIENRHHTRVTKVVIPNWSIVVPLTMLSVWWLLSKHRTSLSPSPRETRAKIQFIANRQTSMVSLNCIHTSA